MRFAFDGLLTMSPIIAFIAATGFTTGPDSPSVEIERLIAESGAESVSVAHLDLHHRRELLINADTSYHPASTMKVAVMMEVFRQAREGRFRLDDPLPVRNDFASIADASRFSIDADSDGDRTLYGKIGRTESIRELVRLMIVRSSNLATNLIVELAGAKRVSDQMKQIGAADMVVMRGVEDNRAYERGLNNSASARSLMVIMRRIAEGKAVSRTDSAEMVRILQAQEFNEGIPAGLPRGTKVAHKTGWITGIYHDAAIVYHPGRKPYVLVIMTRGIRDEKRAHRLVADISRVVFESLSYDGKWKTENGKLGTLVDLSHSS